MKLIKFITYYNGIIKVEYSRGFEPNENKIPHHADIVKVLKDKGIKSSQIVSCGIAQVTPDNRLLIIENDFTGNVRIEDVVRDAINRGKNKDDPTQQFLFERER